MGVDYEHKCFILTESEKDSRKKIVESEKLKGYIFFDYEACQIDGIHVPNLVIVEKVCFNCINNNQCIKDFQIFKFYDNDSFGSWLFSEENQPFTCIAHNFKVYDGIFIKNILFLSMLNPKLSLMALYL